MTSETPAASTKAAIHVKGNITYVKEARRGKNISLQRLSANLASLQGCFGEKSAKGREVRGGPWHKILKRMDVLTQVGI